MNTKRLHWIVLCTIVICSIFTGCQVSRTITLRTIPNGAEVEIFSERGFENFPILKTDDDGLSYTFKFDTEPLTYNMEIYLENYEPEIITISKDDEKYNPKTVKMSKSKKITDFFVNLQREVVRVVERREIQITERGYAIETKAVRAWVEDIEREAMAASHIVKLDDKQSIYGMAISADSNTIVFSLVEQIYDDTRREKKEVANLRSISTQGGGITEITSGQWLDAYPCLNPDGFLFFCSNRLRKNSADIFRISSQKTSAIAVIRQTSEGNNYEPSVSKKGVIAFTYKPVYKGNLQGVAQVWSLGGENQYPTQLREGSMPAISSDGLHIAYIGPDKQLWKVPIDGQNPVQLTTSSIQIEGKKHPIWSPNGKYILFASDVGKDSKDNPNYDIWMIRSDGTGLRQLTTNGSLDDFPVVSPDKKYIYFVSNRGFKEGIWRIPFPESN